MTAGPTLVYEVFIRTTPERLWEAVTRPECTRRYFYGTAVECDWRPGSRCVYREDDGSVALEGEVLEVDPERRVVMSFVMAHDPEARKDRPSRVRWEIEPWSGRICKLTLVHDGFEGETATAERVRTGWNPVLSGLKTLLETGEPLDLRR